MIRASKALSKVSRFRSPHKGTLNLRQYIDLLRGHKELVEITAPVDPHLELAEIHRRVAAADGPALLFRNVQGSSFPVATNLFGSKQRIALAFSNEPERSIEHLVGLITGPFPPTLKRIWQYRRSLAALSHLRPKKQRRAPVMDREIEPNLEALPMLQSWPLDGGHFLTLPLVYTEPIDSGPPNLGIYRIHRYNRQEAGLHWQIAKGGGFHYHQAEAQQKLLPVTIFLGGPPALIVSAIAPLPENVSELLLAGVLQSKRLGVTREDSLPHPLIAECEFALVGEAQPHERRMEGPFGDHYGYYSWAHPFPLFRCRRFFHRKEAIFPATVVGKPQQEDYHLGNYLQRLLKPLVNLAIPGIQDLWSYGETGFHSLSAARVHERYARECMATAFRILGEGQLSLTKFLMVTDQPVDLTDFSQVLQAVLERFHPETDLFILAHLAMDTLDYTGPALNQGSRGILLGIGEKIRTLPEAFSGKLPRPIEQAIPFCPGCLVIDGIEELSDGLLQHLFNAPAFKNWPLVILVDSASKATTSSAHFLWTVFTRFEPAADIYAQSTTTRHHLSYKGPIFIDARMKPSYPPTVEVDEVTEALVNQRWSQYFPKGMEMGDSHSAHVY